MKPPTRDQLWHRAKAASRHRYLTARKLGCDDERSKAAWIAEDRAWQHFFASKADKQGATK